MAIQTINLTVPGGDTPRSANTKINANFSNQTHAASRLVGASAGQVPLAENVARIAMASEAIHTIESSFDLNTAQAGDLHLVKNTVVNSPPTKTNSTMYVRTIYAYLKSSLMQIAYELNTGCIMIRYQSGSQWGSWVGMGGAVTYDATTAAGANVTIDTNGRLLRSTSSERYKDILAPLVLDDARYADAMALKPIVYRSTADADNPAYHYYSFSAEELGTYDPAFTLWRDTETVTDADGNVSEQPLAERQAEGININALLAMSHAIAIKQGELIKGLQDQVIEQREAIAALQQTNP